MKKSVYLFAILLLPAVPNVGHALTDYCVSNSQQLDSALEALPFASDSIVRIKLREGSYQAGNGAVFIGSQAHSNQTVDISGGWSGPNGTCQNKRFGSTRTVVNGSAASPALYVNTGANYTGNLLGISDLTLRNSVYNGANASACLLLYVYPGSTATIDRLKIDACTTPGNSVSSMYLQNVGGELSARNIAVTGGSSPQSGAVGVSTSGGGVTHLSQLSITDNQGGGASAFAGLYLYNDSSYTYLSNSVVWANQAGASADDIYTIGTGIYFNHVHYDTLGGPVTNIAPGSGDPGFMSPGNPHLRSTSGLIDHGVNNGDTGVYDADGAPRTQGSVVDIGAYETNPDSLFANGFDQ